MPLTPPPAPPMNGLANRVQSEPFCALPVSSQPVVKTTWPAPSRATDVPPTAVIHGFDGGQVVSRFPVAVVLSPASPEENTTAWPWIAACTTTASSCWRFAGVTRDSPGTL